MLYQVLQNSKSYFRCVHHRLVPGKCLERHCHRSKMNSWYWQNKYIPDTGKDSGVWKSFVPRTHFYRQKTKFTNLKPAPNLVPTTTCRPPKVRFTQSLSKQNTFSYRNRFVDRLRYAQFKFVCPRKLCKLFSNKYMTFGELNSCELGVFRF